ncbi:MAG: hypothetical protein LBE09_01275 [Christensenellaceae bacterium]|jgi:hypothetical protein|nr:hypothetical protein [Christensenellaceae bacterium]
MKKILTVTILIISAVIIAMALASCGNRIKVEYITVDVVEVELGTIGESSVRKINASVMPANASNQMVTFYLADTISAEYINVTSKGEITSKGIVTPEDVHATVRVASQSETSVHVDIKVTVKTGSVQRLSFSTTSIKLTLDGAGHQLVPIITPNYAQATANLRYQSANPEIATVNSVSGFVTPVSRGETVVEVFASSSHSQGATASIRVIVGYAPLNYGLRVRDDNQAIYKQIVNVPEVFTLELFKNNSDKCDPDPEIIWQRNGSAIPGGNVQNAKVIKIDPVNIGMTTAGSHVIRAIIKSVDDEQVLEIPPINLYNPLTTFNVVKLSAGYEFSVNDSIMLRASHGSGQYPPDSYVWNLLTASDIGDLLYTDTSLISKEKPLGNTYPQKNQDRDVGNFNFTPSEVGEYYIVSYPMVNGVRQDSARRVVYIGQVDLVASTTDVTGIYIDGYMRGSVYLPYVRWDALPYAGEMTVMIRNLDDTTKSALLSSYSDASYFPVHNGVLVPESVATLNESFSVKIRSSKYGYTKEYIYTANTITSDMYKYLDEEITGYNNYIATVEELADILNYISIFRPSSYKVEAFGDVASAHAYQVNLYIPITYTDIREIYDPNNKAPALVSGNQTSEVNALVWTAFTCYSSTGSAEYAVTLMSDGSYTISLKYADSNEFTYETTTQDKYIEKPTIPHYTTNPTPARALPIDKLPSERSMSVVTSEQLVYAITHGYKPVPVELSPAAIIYNSAREVLCRIIDDTMTDATKIHAIYDYLTTEIVYDYVLAAKKTDLLKYDGFYLEGVFINGKAVCDGISKAFNLLSWMEGIASMRVVGETFDGTTATGHAWNITFINGSWYASDATWGNVQMSPGNYEYATHDYLLVTEDFLEINNHVAYGVHPETAKIPYAILGRSSLTSGDKTVSLLLEDADDVQALANYMYDVLVPITDEAHEIWVEVYIADEYIHNNSDDYKTTAGEIGTSISTALKNEGYDCTVSVYYGKDNHTTMYVIKQVITE